MKFAGRDGSKNANRPHKAIGEWCGSEIFHCPASFRRFLRDSILDVKEIRWYDKKSGVGTSFLEHATLGIEGGAHRRWEGRGS